MQKSNNTVIVMRKNASVNKASSRPGGNVAAREQYEICRICGIMISSQYPVAMQNHLEAHRKNDELRRSILEEYGQEVLSLFFN